MTLDDYITQNFPRIRSLEKDVASSQSHIQTDNTRTFGPGFQKVTEVREKVASAAKDTAQTQYNMPCRKEENATLYCPHYSMQATDAFASWKSTYGNNQRSIEFAIDTKSLSQKETKWSWGGSATIPTKIPFVSVSASVEGNGEKLTRTTSDFAAKLSFSAISSFPVRPGQWYDPSLISNYKNSVDKSKMPQGADFFGPDGSLSRTVQRVIVGYKPRVNISFSREFWDEMKTQTRTKGSINVGIGPISFPVFKMDKTVNTHDKVDDKHSMPEVSFEDNSENAFVVLGFVSSRVGQ
ncbi:hypothetical protein BKA69DRAFT_1100636 [Paraphysoderma sedebokerense]|nr:hypothetical protein BKA69DRAFT_1100636 [Paraphysoderma sedebokerense]